MDSKGSFGSPASCSALGVLEQADKINSKQIIETGLQFLIIRRKANFTGLIPCLFKIRLYKKALEFITLTENLTELRLFFNNLIKLPLDNYAVLNQGLSNCLLIGSKSGLLPFRNQGL